MTICTYGFNTAPIYYNTCNVTFGNSRFIFIIMLVVPYLSVLRYALNFSTPCDILFNISSFRTSVQYMQTIWKNSNCSQFLRQISIKLRPLVNTFRVLYEERIIIVIHNRFISTGKQLSVEARKYFYGFLLIELRFMSFLLISKKSDAKHFYLAVLFKEKICFLLGGKYLLLF